MIIARLYIRSIDLSRNRSRKKKKKAKKENTRPFRSIRLLIFSWPIVLKRYSLGMPETSLSGRNTRIARNVRRSISSSMPCENAVMNLPQNTHTPPHFTTYYSITLILTLLKYLSYTTMWLTSVLWPNLMGDGE